LDVDEAQTVILNPSTLWQWSEALSRKAVPKAAGVYGWWFRNLDIVPSEGWVQFGEWRLLYVGISNDLRRRLGFHCQGSAVNSTLRKSLLTLLVRATEVDKALPASWSHESALSSWLNQNGRVCWADCGTPKLAEANLLGCARLPLNLMENRGNVFGATLRTMRTSDG
jgi:predicted GIY-YIG superfamily endonuclease